MSATAPKRHRWMRLFASGAVLAMLGMVSTIVVAWTLAVLVVVPGNVLTPGNVPMHARKHIARAGAAHATDEDRPSVYVTHWRRFGSSFFASGTNTGYFPAPPQGIEMEAAVPASLRPMIVPWLAGGEPFPTTDAIHHFGSRGWPMDAVWCEFITATNTPWVGTPAGGIELPWPKVTPSWYFPPPPLPTLPYRPVWRGLIVDTIFYAAVWWVPLFGFGRWRAWRRRKRGVCVKCGYDLRGISAAAPCPECGSGRS